MTRWPDFIVAGSPKCGTTALHTYLGEQPGVFVPVEKEPHYFSSDIRLRKQTSREGYLALFESSSANALLGEVSVWYLYSKVAALDIRESCGPIKIVAMLRNPIEAIASLHAQLVYEGDETETDLRAALAANRVGRPAPPSSWKGSECLDYVRVYDYVPQLERFFDVFGRERVHLVLFDDWRSDTEAAFGGICRFLGVEPSGEIEFKTVNPNTTVRSPGLRDWSRAHNSSLRRFARALFPGEALRHRVRRPLARLLKRSYTREEPRPDMAEELRVELVQTLGPGVGELSELLDRDLTHWLEAQVA